MPMMPLALKLIHYILSLPQNLFAGSYREIGEWHNLCWTESKNDWSSTKSLVSGEACLFSDSFGDQSC